MTNSSERRRSKRFLLNQIIKLSIGKEEYIQAEGININEHGLLCKTSEYVEPQTKLFLMIELPVKNKIIEISFEGIVIWSDDNKDNYKAGIEISEIEEKDKEILINFLNSIK